MLFLDLNTSCNSPTLLVVLTVVKNILKIIQITGPIISILSLIYTIVLLIKNPDEKKYIKRIKNSLIALVLLFLIPTIVNAFVSTLGENTKFSDCWNNVNITSAGSSTFKEIEAGKSTSQLITDPTEYQRGTSKPTTSSSNNKSSSSGNKAGEGNTKSNKVIFIGDSRTVQMYAYLNGTWSGANYSSGGIHIVGNDIYVAEGAKGLAWMKDVGIPAAKKYFVKGNAIVILMGVNDLSNADNYISYINSNSSSWKSNGSSLYFVSVNPCQGSYSNLNSTIINFNSKLKNGLNSSVGWIDTNTVLTNNGFKTTDGLHYDESTYKVIYDYIKNRV